MVSIINWIVLGLEVRAYAWYRQAFSHWITKSKIYFTFSVKDGLCLILQIANIFSNSFHLKAKRAKNYFHRLFHSENYLGKTPVNHNKLPVKMIALDLRVRSLKYPLSEYKISEKIMGFLAQPWPSIICEFCLDPVLPTHSAWEAWWVTNSREHDLHCPHTFLTLPGLHDFWTVVV